MPNTIDIVRYNPEWQNIFDNEAVKLKISLKHQCTNIYHVGSTAVPNLAAKPVIDIVIELAQDTYDVQTQLSKLGYRYKGEFNIPFRQFFSQDIPAKIHLHVYNHNNPEIKLLLAFRDFLRTSALHRKHYENLKIHLATAPSAANKIGKFTEYTLGKNDFIADIISKIGIQAIYLRLCTHYAEWQEYNNIRRFYISDKDNLIDNVQTKYHIVIYQGARIVGALQIDNLINGCSRLKFLHIQKSLENPKTIKYLKKFVRDWLTLQGLCFME